MSTLLALFLIIRNVLEEVLETTEMINQRKKERFTSGLLPGPVHGSFLCESAARSSLQLDSLLTTDSRLVLWHHKYICSMTIHPTIEKIQSRLKELTHLLIHFSISGAKMPDKN